MIIKYLRIACFLKKSFVEVEVCIDVKEEEINLPGTNI